MLQQPPCWAVWLGYSGGQNAGGSYGSDLAPDEGRGMVAFSEKEEVKMPSLTW